MLVRLKRVLKRRLGAARTPGAFIECGLALGGSGIVIAQHARAGRTARTWRHGSATVREAGSQGLESDNRIFFLIWQQSLLMVAAGSDGLRPIRIAPASPDATTPRPAEAGRARVLPPL